jgi:hypothetical protein
MDPIIGLFGSFAFLTVLFLGLLALKIYGVVIAFRKKWYFGVLALIVPFFADIIAVAKLVFKKDLLAE